MLVKYTACTWHLSCTSYPAPLTSHMQLRRAQLVEGAPHARALLSLLSGCSQRVQALVFDRVAAELFGASALQVLVLLFLRPEAANALSSCIEGQLFSCRCVSNVDAIARQICAFTTLAIRGSYHDQQP